MEYEKKLNRCIYNPPLFKEKWFYLLEANGEFHPNGELYNWVILKEEFKIPIYELRFPLQ